MAFNVIISGDITQKGYEKKRAKLLGPYLSRGEYGRVHPVNNFLLSNLLQRDLT